MNWRRAFTLVELLVVIAIIALLLSMLAPTLQRAKHLTRRAVCASRLSNFGRGVAQYASEYRDCVFFARRSGSGMEGRVQVCLDYAVDGSTDPYAMTDWVGAAAKFGLCKDAFECPDRPGCYRDDANDDGSWIIFQKCLGYQYFGGIKHWTNPQGTFKSRSPVFLSSADARWALAADCTMKIDNVWGGGRPSAYEFMPPHRFGNPWPEGGNAVYCDGSTRWTDFEKMFFFHSWNPAARFNYWYQEDVGELTDAQLLALKAKQ
ncbi:MAG TPA: type II secretion system protein [Phycisphaerae bacterium]|nr:type II secretion system protein [Phycisphaerae bacterium]HQL73409.1 type II secretion system protein [Phycisphaerae bacterium]